MKTKRKSLGEIVWDCCFSNRPNEWHSIDEDIRQRCRNYASRIRREVIRREVAKAEGDLGVRAIHGERLARAKLMLETRRREKAQAAVILGREK